MIGESLAYLLAGTTHDAALKLLQGAGDLVTDCGMALLVVNAAAEETVATGGGSGCCMTVCHLDG